MARILLDCRACLGVAFWGGLKALLFGAVGFVTAIALFFLVFRFIDPPSSALMLRKSWSGEAVTQTWVPLSRISRSYVRAVVNSEDSRFCKHFGVDTIEFRNALRQAQGRGNLAVRGASTISMQVVKNLVLWPEQTYLRKGLELMITPIMEFVWPKRRILEVYLNIAEWGPGIFGAEAAARYHFKKSARRIRSREAALLASALPNPIARRPARPGRKMRRRATRLQKRVKVNLLDSSCFS